MLTSEDAQKIYGAVEKLLTVDSVDLLVSAENRVELFEKLTTRVNAKRVREENDEKENEKEKKPKTDD